MLILGIPYLISYRIKLDFYSIVLGFYRFYLNSKTRITRVRPYDFVLSVIKFLLLLRRNTTKVIFK